MTNPSIFFRNASCFRSAAIAFIIASSLSLSLFINMTSQQSNMTVQLKEEANATIIRGEPLPFCEAPYQLYHSEMKDIICSGSILPNNATSKILFLHFPKTGGESLEKSLGIAKNHEIMFNRHDQYKTPHLAITIIRNPFDRMFSWFRFCLYGYRGILPLPHLHYYAAHDKVNATLASQNMSTVKVAFELWLETIFLQPKFRHNWVTVTSQEFLGGMFPLHVDYIIRFEHYAADFAILASAMGKNITIVHENSSTEDKGKTSLKVLGVKYSYDQEKILALLKHPYKEMYTERARKLVEMQFASDLLAFNYSF